MRQWMRAERVRYCGYCGAEIPVGAPVLEITMHQTRRRDRCALCAGEPIPETLPAAGELTAPIDAVGAREIAMPQWLLDARLTQRPTHFPDLVRADNPAEQWMPFRDGGE